MKSNLGSLASQALEYECENDDDSNIFQLVRKFTLYFQETEDFKEPLNKKGVQNQNETFYNQVWKTEIAKLSKAESYLRYKTDIRIEDYLTKMKNIKH